MKFEEQLIKITNLPMDKISRGIINYTVGIIIIHEDRKDNPAQFVGSGTLVQINSIYGILTANHILDVLPSNGYIGLVLPTPSQTHRYQIESSFLTKISIARCELDADGPDLGIIILPQTNVRQISAYASFYNLSFDRDSHVNNPINTKAGVWVLCGFPGDYLTKESLTSSFNHVLGCCNLCGFGTVSREYSSDGFDYLEIDINHENDLPRSFCGVSGGGVWQVLLEQSPKGDLIDKSPLCSGVAFYQSEIVNNRSTIKCHGRRSIYKIAYEHVIDHFKDNF